VSEKRQSSPGRARVEEVALELFAQEGIANTTLQRIADAMGVTKAAVYWHYRSKEEIVLGVLKPALAELRRIVEAAEQERGKRSRVESALAGTVDLVVTHRRLAGVLLGDSALRETLEQHPEISELLVRLVELLQGAEGDPGSQVAATLYMSGLVGPATDPRVAGLDDDVLREYLLDAGRRLLLARRPRR